MNKPNILVIRGDDIGWYPSIYHRDEAEPFKSKIGTFADALMAEAKKKGWIVISMKDDWKTIFPPAK